MKRNKKRIQRHCQGVYGLEAGLQRRIWGYEGNPTDKDGHSERKQQYGCLGVHEDYTRKRKEWNDKVLSNQE